MIPDSEYKLAQMQKLTRLTRAMSERLEIDLGHAERIVAVAGDELDLSQPTDRLISTAVSVAKTRVAEHLEGRTTSSARRSKASGAPTKKHTTRSRCASSSKAKKKGARKARRRNRKKR